MITRFHPRDHRLQFVAVLRADGTWALPGDMLGKGEEPKLRCRMLFDDKVCERDAPNRDAHARARLAERSEELFADADRKVVYRGYVDDPRNTDNAWVETTAYHLHCERELGGLLPLSRRATASSSRTRPPRSATQGSGGRALVRASSAACGQRAMDHQSARRTSASTSGSTPTTSALVEKASPRSRTRARARWAARGSNLVGSGSLGARACSAAHLIAERSEGAMQRALDLALVLGSGGGSGGGRRRRRRRRRRRSRGARASTAHRRELINAGARPADAYWTGLYAQRIIHPSAAAPAPAAPAPAPARSPHSMASTATATRSGGASRAAARGLDRERHQRKPGPRRRPRSPPPPMLRPRPRRRRALRARVADAGRFADALPPEQIRAGAAGAWL